MASGLALTMFGLGLSALWGQAYSGLSAPAFPRLYIPGLSDLPFVGKLLFAQDGLLYLSLRAWWCWSPGCSTGRGSA